MEKLIENLVRRVNLGDSLTRSAYRDPDHLAIISGDDRLTYQEFHERTNAFARALMRRGVGRGDSVIIMSGNSVEFLITYYACARIGAINVPINLGWKPPEIAYVIGHSGARVAVVESQLLEILRNSTKGVKALTVTFVTRGIGPQVVLEQDSDGDVVSFDEAIDAEERSDVETYVSDNDPLSYLYTSGTTAAPKGVVSSHLAVYLETLGVALEDSISRRDVMGTFMPLFHTAQLNGLCTPAVAVGATMVLMRGFEPKALLKAIEQESLTIIFGLPFMYREMLNCPEISTTDLSSLRLALYAMAPMPDDLLLKAMETFKCDFTLGFGQTEMNPVTTVFRPEHQLSHRGAVGTASVNVRVAIMDEQGQLLPPGHKGEIVYRSPQALTCYLDNPQATEEVFRHGWFHSGDVGYLGDDQMLWFEDRSKDVIKTGGENVSSIEVEKAIYQTTPEAAEVVVIGLPHDRWGEAITAFVTLAEDSSIDEQMIIARAKSAIEHFKAPKAVVMVDSLPKTSTGKVQKHLLRSEYSNLFHPEGT